MKEALRNTESLMMGGRRKRIRTPDLADLKANDLLQIHRSETGQVLPSPHHRDPWTRDESVGGRGGGGVRAGDGEGRR